MAQMTRAVAQKKLHAKILSKSDDDHTTFLALDNIIP